MTSLSNVNSTTTNLSQYHIDETEEVDAIESPLPVENQTIFRQSSINFYNQGFSPKPMNPKSQNYYSHISFPHSLSTFVCQSFLYCTKDFNIS